MVSRPFQSKELSDLLRAWFVFNSFKVSPLIKNGLRVLDFSDNVLGRGLTEKIVRETVYKQFVGGKDSIDTLSAVNNLSTRNVGSVLQYSAEQDIGHQRDSESLKDTYKENLKHFLNSIRSSASSVQKDGNHKPFAAFKVTALCNCKLLIDVTKELESRGNTFKPTATPDLELQSSEIPKDEWKELVDSLMEIGQLAYDNKVHVLVDAEQTYFQPAIRHLVIHHMMPAFNKTQPIIYNTVQGYLKTARQTIEEDIGVAEKMNYTYAAKIVRGAYMDQERSLSKEQNYEDPIHPNKMETDRSYSDVVDYALKSVVKGRSWIKVGSHNPKSIEHAVHMIKTLGISRTSGQVTFGQLLGMGDYLTYPLAQSGYLAYKIMPYGPVREVVPYLLRRAQENSSAMINADNERKLLNQELMQRILCK